MLAAWAASDIVEPGGDALTPLARSDWEPGREDLDGARLGADLPHDCPTSLATALRARDVRAARVWREHRRVYLRASAPQEDLFARYTTDPADEPTLAHEAAVRKIVGTAGGLRAPPILERGSSWLLERAIQGEPCTGRAAVDAVTAAAAALPRLDLPPGPAGRGRRVFAPLHRAARLVRSPLPSRDVVTARLILARPKLPLVTSHGDFHVGNVLFADGAAWVIDWEMCGRRPAGLDLMQMWATLELEEDRDRLFEAAVRHVGGSRRQLLRLRYAVLVGTIAVLLAGAEFERDAGGARRLLRLLPEIRAHALRG
jgi:Phosphotransferase enzyme family